MMPYPEAYHNPAAVWWGALAASAAIRIRRSPSDRLRACAVDSARGAGSLDVRLGLSRANLVRI